MQASINKQHGAADCMEIDAVKIAKITQIQPLPIIISRLVQTVTDISKEPPVAILLPVYETVAVKAGSSRPLRTIWCYDPRLCAKKALDDVRLKPPNIDIDPQCPVVAGVKAAVDKAISHLCKAGAAAALVFCFPS